MARDRKAVKSFQWTGLESWTKFNQCLTAVAAELRSPRGYWPSWLVSSIGTSTRIRSTDTSMIR